MACGFLSKILLGGFLVTFCVAAPATSAPGFNSGIAGGSGGFDSQQFRPFGSDRGCAALLNETLAQYDYRIIPERILITADMTGNSFSSGSFTGGSNQQLDTWANQACGDMNTAVGYLNSACKFGSSSTFNNQQEVVAQKKVAALAAIRDYLCTINQQFNPTNLKEMAINNGAQCARRMDQSDFGCNDIQMGSSSGQFISMLPNSAMTNIRRMLKYGTLIIFSMQYYNQEECKYLTDLTNCIQDKFNRGSDFCGSRAASHYGRIFDIALQGVQCSAGGFSTYNTYGNDPFNNFNSNNNFNRYPSNSFDSSRYPNNNNNNNFGGAGSNSWNNNNQNSGSGWPSNSGSSWNSNQNSGSGWPNSGGSSWSAGSQSSSGWPSGSNSGSNTWPNNNNNNQYGSSSFGSSSSWDNYGSNNLPPYTYRRNSGAGLQSVMAMIVTLALTATLAY